MNVPGEQSERSILLERKVIIAEELDGLIEQCRRGRLPLAQALGRLLPRTIELVGARGALVRAFDEGLERRAYRSGEFPDRWDAAVPERFETGPLADLAMIEGEATLVLRRLDCADEVVGIAAFAYPPAIEPAALERARDQCRTASEQIDNYLEGIAAAARKQRLSVDASAALRSTVLEEGADRAMDLLSHALGLEEVALVFADSDARGRSEVHYRLYRQGDVVADSVDNPDRRLEGAILKEGGQILHPSNHAVAEILGGLECVETALINGLIDVAPVGKLIVRNAVGNLDPGGMDVLHIFAECLSQRLVDYNRERQMLCHHFSPATVTKLVREPGYLKKYLTPRVEPVAILFSDMSSFTAISERVLAGAAEIGELIDRWAGEAVEILHRHGGAFDKLVGDCVIGLFGPPFFQDSPEQRIVAAVKAAVAIARMTRRIGEERGYDERIRAAGAGPGLGAAAGVNLGPTWVGLFGPNQDYTGFSSYMNNTARLQGVATWNEVLLMDGIGEAPMSRLRADGFVFDGPHQVKVKNVKDPIAYHRVSGGR